MSVLAPALVLVLALAYLMVALARTRRTRTTQQAARSLAMSRHPCTTPAQAFGMRLRAYELTRAAGRTRREDQW